jgi:glycerophosphoryl diester phosphodiesterase
MSNSIINNGSLDLQGHRGSRGLMPENTIPAMKKAIDLGVATLEMDVVISKDNKVVVSHEPYFSEVITTTPEGKYLTKEEAQNHLIYSMTYDSIMKYDVGLKPHPVFPAQQKIKVYKPLLSELIDSAEVYAEAKGRKILYNIEIKSNKETDNIRHPLPTVFATLLIDVLLEKNILDRAIIQSFDVRPLQFLHNNHGEIKLSYLVEKPGLSLDEQLLLLGFTPDIYSPDYLMVNKKLVEDCHKKNIKIIPWTINTLDEMNKLMAMGVDGIISDYPDLFAHIKNRSHYK